MEVVGADDVVIVRAAASIRVTHEVVALGAIVDTRFTEPLLTLATGDYVCLTDCRVVLCARLDVRRTMDAVTDFAGRAVCCTDCFTARLTGCDSLSTEDVLAVRTRSGISGTDRRVVLCAGLRICRTEGIATDRTDRHVVVAYWFATVTTLSYCVTTERLDTGRTG